MRHYGLDHLGSQAILTDASAHPIGNITFDGFGNRAVLMIAFGDVSGTWTGNGRTLVVSAPYLMPDWRYAMLAVLGMMAFAFALGLILKFMPPAWKRVEPTVSPVLRLVGDAAVGLVKIMLSCGVFVAAVGAGLLMLFLVIQFIKWAWNF